ncbi:helix-turn-helix domain-containing protein [Flavobacterium sp. KMS]|uniref:helix-turn-helix domain-containing protein n=1 Tax=unclassified Flavobacterium TaxID=196869 RepID=UPI00057D4BC6|nr:helix-turn-helix domain-containing protein [Flavobacterium sp. KMS]KIA96310.1 AraC family transcriptional regulator [Flavobacterium sp. KMS]
MNKIITYSLEHHTSLFTTEENKNDYFYVQINDHPYIDEPYRAESYAIEFLKKGSIIMQTRLTKIVIHAPAIITLGPSVIRSFTKNSDEILMDIIFFKPQFFLKNQANVFFLNQYDFFDNSQMHVFSLEKGAKIKFGKIFDLISDTLNGDNNNQSSILRSYLYILVFELDAIKQTITDNYDQNPLFEKFKEILAKEFLRERSVGYYADSLNVTRKYLSEVIKKNSGKTASNWIDDFIVLEAKVLLQNKALTINQISEMLNFSNQSVFGKFFKNSAGFSPLEYRKNNG